MNFYFYTSYQQSPVGFQLSELTRGAQQAQLIRDEAIQSAQLRSLLTNSGAAFAVGCAEDTDYLVIHNLSHIDADDRQWYISLGVSADKSCHEAFTDLVRKICLDYTGFLCQIGDWFRATPTQPLSYTVDAEALERWMDAPVPETAGMPFFRSAHPVVEQFCAMLEKAGEGIERKLFVLVPESTVAYFFNQNPLFVGELPHYLFTSKEFGCLLVQQEPPREEEPAAQKAQPIWEQLGITKEEFIGYVAAGLICCTGLLMMAGGWLAKLIRRFR